MSTTPGIRRMSRSSAAASSWRRDPAIEDPVAVVGDERRRRPPPGGGARQPRAREPALAERPRERHDLDRQAAPGAEARHELLGGDEDDLAPRGGGDDPLPRERAAVALDEVEPRVDLVGAVDREVERVRRQLRDGRGRATARAPRSPARWGRPGRRAPGPPRRPAPARTPPRPGRSRARRGRSGPPREPARRPGPPGGRDPPECDGAGSGLGDAPTRPGLLGVGGGPSQTSPAGLA